MDKICDIVELGESNMHENKIPDLVKILPPLASRWIVTSQYWRVTSASLVSNFPLTTSNSEESMEVGQLGRLIRGKFGAPFARLTRSSFWNSPGFGTSSKRRWKSGIHHLGYSQK